MRTGGSRGTGHFTGSICIWLSQGLDNVISRLRLMSCSRHCSPSRPSMTYLFSPIRLSIFLRALANMTETSLSSCDTFLNPFSPVSCTGAAAERRDAITLRSKSCCFCTHAIACNCRSYCHAARLLNDHVYGAGGAVTLNSDRAPPIYLMQH